MKKIYINPKIEVFELKVSHQLLAGSELGIGENGDASKAESRRGFFMDFEEEDEVFGSDED